MLSTVTLEKRKTDQGTSPRIVRLIRGRAGSNSFFHGAKTILEQKKNSVCKLKKKSRKKCKARTVLDRGGGGRARYVTRI